MPNLRDTLFLTTSFPGYCQLRVEPSAIGDTVLLHSDLQAARKRVMARFFDWRSTAEERLRVFDRGDRPRALMTDLSEGLLAAFRDAPLVDPYAVYQRFMDYWVDTLQDDVYLVSESGWVDASRPRPLPDGPRSSTDSGELAIGRQRLRSDLLPVAVLKATWLAHESAGVAEAEIRNARLEQEITALIDEHAVEGGSLEVVADEGGHITRKAVLDRLKELAAEGDSADEVTVLSTVVDLMDQQAATRAQLKTAAAALDTALLATYPVLSTDDVKDLVVTGKWLADLEHATSAQVDAAFRALVGRLSQLSERYGTPLPAIELQTYELSERVRRHLATMGVS